MENQWLFKNLQPKEKQLEKRKINMAQSIRQLLRQGFSCKEIQKKTGCKSGYVSSVRCRMSAYDRNLLIKSAKNMKVGTIFKSGLGEFEFISYSTGSDGEVWVNYTNENDRKDNVKLVDLVQDFEIVV